MIHLDRVDWDKLDGSILQLQFCISIFIYEEHNDLAIKIRSILSQNILHATLYQGAQKHVWECFAVYFMLLSVTKGKRPFTAT